MTSKSVDEPYEARKNAPDDSRSLAQSGLKHGNCSGSPNSAPRCNAKRRKKTKICQSPAMANGRCRLHGGLSTGPRTMEGLERSRKANWKHGLYSAESKALTRALRQEFKAMKALLQDVRELS